MSVGDSLAPGFQSIGGPSTNSAAAGYNQGYADQLFKLARDGGGEHLLLVKRAVAGKRRVHDREQLAALDMPGCWYAVRRGDMLGIALDSTDPGNPEQLAWLEETLANTDAKWKLAALHHPPYSSGFHGSNPATREAFVPLFERYGVQIVFSGHEHDYQRTDPHQRRDLRGQRRRFPHQADGHSRLHRRRVLHTPLRRPEHL